MRIYPFLAIMVILLAACTSQTIKSNLDSMVLKDSLPNGVTFDGIREGPDNIPERDKAYFVTAGYGGNAVHLTIKKLESADFAESEFIAQRKFYDELGEGLTVDNIEKQGHTMDIALGNTEGRCGFAIDGYEFSYYNSGRAYDNTQPIDNELFKELCMKSFDNALNILKS